MDDAIEISDLHFSYGDLEIFRGLSLGIPRGKVVAILGAQRLGQVDAAQADRRPARARAKGAVKVAGKDVHQLAPDELYGCASRWA